MSEVVFIVSTDASDAERLARPLRDRGWDVLTETHDSNAACSAVGSCRPVAVVISLDQDAESACDLACALNVAASTRDVPVLFVGGDPEATAAAQLVRPDASFMAEAELAWAIKRYGLDD